MKKIIYLIAVILQLILLSGCISVTEEPIAEEQVKTEIEVIAKEETKQKEEAPEKEKEQVTEAPQAPIEIESKAVIETKKIYVAVSNFQINTNEVELQGLSTDIPQTLTEAFIGGRYIKPVERQEFERLFDEYKLSLSGLTDEETAVEVGKVLGAEYILLGSMIKVGGNVKMNCRLIRTETSEIVFTDSVRGAYDTLFDLEDELSALVENYVKTLEENL
jgi:curli biogenesis system outer membrane secretion channel CsgG